MKRLALALFLCGFPASVFAAEGPLSAAEDARERALIAAMTFQKGEVTLRGGIAKVTVPDSLRFLGPQDAEIVRMDLFHNLPGDVNRVLGMLVPAEFSKNHRGLWYAPITYAEGGYIDDRLASAIDYDKLLNKMKDDARSSNARRRELNLSTVELIGWAKPPRYDKSAHKLYFAKELNFSNSPNNALNYNIRILGRRGHITVNIAAAMDRLELIETAMPQILATINYQPGFRYEDFRPGDPVDANGFPALIAPVAERETGLRRHWTFKVERSG